MIKMCKCLETKSSHKVDRIMHYNRYPLKGGGWISFSVLKCLDCGGFTGWPPNNFELALNESSELLKIELNQICNGILIV